MSQSNFDDDLTTDAIPSPPRDEIKQEQEKEPETNTPPKTKTKRVYKKTKKTGPTAFASVINISNSVGTHVGSNYHVYLGSKPPGGNLKKDFILTDAIKKLFESKERLQRKHLVYISGHINEEWRTTARLLDYSDGQISQFYENYIKIGIKEVIYQLLLDWIQNEADAATIGRLSKILWETSQQEAVNRWSQFLDMKNEQ